MNLKTLDSLFDNKTFTTVVSLTLALYAGLAAPALPDSIIYFFDTIVCKLLFLFLIGFVASRNVQVALMIALAFLVTLYVANKRATEHYINYGYLEHFYDSNEEHLKKIVCDWANSLSDTTTPKKDEVMSKSLKDIIETNGDMLLKGNKDLTKEKAMELASSETMKNKTIADLCKQEEKKEEKKPMVELSKQEKETVGKALGNLVDTISGFTGNAEHYQNYDVLPADNLEGASDKMYAPIDF